LEGCDCASVCVLDEGDCTTPAYTAEVAAKFDALQHRLGQGPTVDAIAGGVSFYASALNADPRWPALHREAEACGLASLLALPLFTNGTLGALSLYGREARSFTPDDLARGLLLAALAGLAFAALRSHEDAERRAANLQAALASREVIGQAQGILMERERISADEAFDLLRRASQHLNLKLREVAQTLVETGEQPVTGANESEG
jgi:hypothetical protein